MVLSASEIQKCCLDIVENSKLKKLPSTDYFTVLLLTGMRFNDVKLCYGIGCSDVSFQLKPSKNNAIRTMSIENLPLSFVAYLNGVNCFQYCISYSSLLRYFNQCSSYVSITTNKKELGLHLFRHNYMKQLFTSGKSINEVASITGEKTISSAANYIFSSITI